MLFGAPATTNERGEFTIAIPAGEQWSLVAEWRRPLPDKPYNFERGDTPLYVADGTTPLLRIVVR